MLAPVCRGTAWARTCDRIVSNLYESMVPFPLHRYVHLLHAYRSIAQAAAYREPFLADSVSRSCPRRARRAEMYTKRDKGGSTCDHARRPYCTLPA
jgi:hypothetical protein